MEKDQIVRRQNLQRNVEKVMKKFLPDVDLRINKNKKAIWSYTEEEYNQMEQKKEDEIIQFMDGLDFDEVIQDIEVKPGISYRGLLNSNIV